jgi:hypothetical protein
MWGLFFSSICARPHQVGCMGYYNKYVYRERPKDERVLTWQRIAPNKQSATFLIS